METNTTPFDLNRAIQLWRENLNQSPALRRENLEELEIHLRDSVAALQTRGLSEQEAFIIAVRRAGSSVALGTEFGKVNLRSVWLDRVFWMLVGNLVFWFVSSLLSTIGSGLLFAGFKEFGSAGSNSASYFYVAVFSTAIRLLTFAGALVLCWRLFTSNGGPAAKWLAKNSRSSARWAAVAVMGIIAMMLPRLVEGLSTALLVKYYASPTDFTRFATGQSIGNLFASLIQTTVFVFLALWLARRRLLAKT